MRRAWRGNKKGPPKRALIFEYPDAKRGNSLARRQQGKFWYLSQYERRYRFAVLDSADKPPALSAFGIVWKKN